MVFLLLKHSFKKTEFLKPKKIDEKLNIDIITMDLETRAIDGYMFPYCISIYDKIRKKKSFYLLDFNNSKELMINESLKYIMIKEFNRYKVFLHNFSYFDSIFILKYLYEASDKKKFYPIIRDSKFIDLKIC